MLRSSMFSKGAHDDTFKLNMQARAGPAGQGLPSPGPMPQAVLTMRRNAHHDKAGFSQLHTNSDAHTGKST